MDAVNRYPCLRIFKYLSPYFILLLCFLGAACSDKTGDKEPLVAQEPAQLENQVTGYNANSWKTLIPENCKAYFDGCNHCRREVGAAAAACTRKACAKYSKPECRDEHSETQTSHSTQGKIAHYICDKDKQFTVFYGEYHADDQRVKLTEDEIMLSDRQTHIAHTLVRQNSASGEKYSNINLEFWSSGEEAMLRESGSHLYQNCVLKQ